MPSGRWPISIVSTTSFVSGSMRETVPSPPFATHTAPSPTAIAVGSGSDFDRVGERKRGRRDPRNRRVSPVRHPDRSLAEGNRRGPVADLHVRRLPGRQVHSRHGPPFVCEPGEPFSHGQRDRLACELDPVGDSRRDGDVGAQKRVRPGRR